MNTHLVWAGLLATFASGILSANMTAQVPVGEVRFADGAPQIQQAGRSSPVPLADRRIALKMVDRPLPQALQEIAAKAGMRVSFSSEVTAVRRPVTLVADTLTVAEAMSVVLAPHGLHAVLNASKDGFVVVAGRAVTARVVDGVITGKVVHVKTKQPLAGVTIVLDNATKGVVTEENGTFRIPASVGEHSVHVRLIGFVRQTVKVNVAADATVALEVVLEQSASVLDEVVVTGTVIETERKAIPTPITVITAEDIEKRNITRIEDLFRGQVAGIIALEEGTTRYGGNTVQVLGKMETSRIYSRGSASLDGSPNPLKTYVDGVQLLDGSYLGTIDTRTIERIEIITGPQAATIYGAGAMGGVMQIFTKKGVGKAPEVTLNIRYGLLENSFSNNYTPSHNDGIGVTGGIGSELTYSANLSYNYTGAWKPYLFSRGLGASFGGVRTRGPFTLNGSISFTTSSNGTARTVGTGTCGDVFPDCTGSFYEFGGIETGELLVRNIAGIYGRSVSRSSAQTMAVSADYRQSSLLGHHITVGRSQNNFAMDPQRPIFETPIDTLIDEAMSTGQRTTLSYNMTYRPSLGVSTHSFVFGATGSVGKNYSVRGKLVSMSSSGYTEPSVTKSVGDESWGGFGSWRLGLFNQVFLSFGLRGELNKNYGRDHKVDWTPTNGLTYTFEYGNLSVKFLGSYGRATRTPGPEMRLEKISYLTGYDLTQYVSQAEAPKLRPERSRGPQGGIEIYYGNLGSLTVNHYQQTVTDLIQSVRMDSTRIVFLQGGSIWYRPMLQYQNVAKVRQRGWEGTGSVTLAAITLRGTWSWADSRILEVNPNQYLSSYRVGESVSYVPTHHGSLVASYARGNVNVTWSTNFIGSTSQHRFYREEYYSGIGRLKMYGGRWVSPSDRVATGGFSKSNMSLLYRIGSHVSATMNITNVTNAFDSDLGNRFPTLGRTTLFGVSLRRSGR